MRGGREWGPKHGAEPAGVVVTQHRIIVEDDVDMIMPDSRRRRLRVDAETAGHTEVYEQRSSADAEEQVLASTFERVDDVPFEPVLEIDRNRPAEPRVVHLQIDDAAPDNSRRYTSASGFDFGQLGHLLFNGVQSLRGRRKRGPVLAGVACVGPNIA